MTWVILSVVVLLLLLAVRSIWRRKKSGGCAGCPGGCDCGGQCGHKE